MSEFIRTENISFAYEDTSGGIHPAIKNVSISIERGSFVAVLGHNGSGKSTLAKLFNMILTPTDGKLYVDGELVSTPEGADDDTIFGVRRKIGMVHQNPDNQIVSSVVEEDVAFGPENLGVEPSEIRARVDDALKTVGMSEYAQHSPSRLSGGQKQRVAIAGIIAMRPDCIIFDESTAMLDPSGRHDVMETVKKLNRESEITIIHITHDMSEAVMADRVIVLNEGEVFLDGTPSEVFSEVELLRSVRLDVPQTTSLLHSLLPYGFTSPAGLFDAESCAGHLANEINRIKGLREGTA
ncbi:MAG: energy-coupling factor transporter ATPase [Firmicutes bacterium]|nr:energy-coupling factor transporter ATPase [Bacillota bacterium]